MLHTRVKLRAEFRRSGWRLSFPSVAKPVSKRASLVRNGFCPMNGEGIVPTGGHGKTERRNFRVRSRGWGTQARPSPRGRMLIRAS